MDTNNTKSQRKLRPVRIHRRNEREAQQAIDELLKRGYFIITDLTKVHSNLWIAKMMRSEAV